MAEQKKKKSVTIHRSFLIVLLLAAFALGIFVDRGFMLIIGSPPDEEGVGETAGRTGRELTMLRSRVNALVEQALAERQASAVSVYFLDLKTANWFGIREDEKFAPQNLLKLPLMIAYFKWAETDPRALDGKITVPAGRASQTTPRVKRLKPLGPGKAYSVEDLIYRMVVFSDDAAFALLSANLPEGALEKVYRDHGVDYDPDDEENTISLSAYASFYRALFNASYLNRTMSEKALSYLSRSSFREGIVAGVPPNIAVSSRLGELSFPADEGGEQRNVIQLHEIGIVHFPNRPYLIGVMVRGNDFKKLAKTVRDISRFVYREEEQQKERAP